MTLIEIGGLDGIVSTLPVPRFRSVAGEIVEGRRVIEWDDARDMLICWRDQARKYAKTDPRLAAQFSREADDLSNALEAAAKWRRCMDGPNLGRPAFEASVALLNPSTLNPSGDL